MFRPIGAINDADWMMPGFQRWKFITKYGVDDADLEAYIEKSSNRAMATCSFT